MAEAPTLTRFTLTVDAGVAELTLAVPEELNRMPPAFWEELPAALEALEARGDVRVLIIASTGKHFTAGMDVSAFDGSGATPTDRGHAGERSRRHLLKLQDVFSRLERARFPVIAAT
ncbi:MAG: enoyl-CoA hydratase-related protein, partial [Pseudomonadota bacterium]|nr:enoyl-CoA hydratase-related protein [Pseudomonadota bacterium]